MARPTKFTPEIRKKVTDALSAGNTRRAAAAYAHIGESTLEEWVTRGRDGLSKLPVLEAQLEILEAKRGRKAAASAEALRSEIAGMRPYAEFVESMADAEGEAEARYVAALASAAQGGYVVRKNTTTTVTERTLRSGEVVKTTKTVTQEANAPKDSKAITFWLERRRHREFGRRDSIALTGEDGGPVKTQVIGFEIVAPAVQQEDPE